MLFKDLDQSISDMYYGTNPKGIRDAIEAMFTGWNGALVNFFRKKQSEASDSESAAQNVWIKMLSLTQEEKQTRPDLRDLFWSIVRRTRSRGHLCYVNEKDGSERYAVDQALSGGRDAVDFQIDGIDCVALPTDCIYKNSSDSRAEEEIELTDSEDESLKTTTDFDIPQVVLWSRDGTPKMISQHGRFYSAGGCSVTDHQEANRLGIKRQIAKKRRVAYDRKRFQEHKVELMAKHNATARKKTEDRRNAIEQLKLLRGKNEDRN